MGGVSPHRVERVVLPGPYCPVRAELPDATMTWVSMPPDAVICTLVSGATIAAPSAGVTVTTAGGAGLLTSRCTAECPPVTGPAVATYVIPPPSTSPAAPATSHPSFRTPGA